MTTPIYPRQPEPNKYNEDQHPVLAQINRAIWEAQERDGRRHLGASLIGRECHRELWYTFRWATQPNHRARLLRLFNRGHLEEFRFVEWLRMAGVKVKEYETPNYHLVLHHPSGQYALFTPDQWTQAHQSPVSNELEDVTGLKHHEVMAKYVSNIEVPAPGQMRVVDAGGHFGGSLDGECEGLPGIERYGLPLAARGLLEFKTHSEKSFKKLCDERVKRAKPEHWTQMQIYMFKRSLAFACYLAINKNTDELYTEIVLPDHAHAREHINKAGTVIYSNRPPPRIGASASNFKCKFCDHRQVCWFGAQLQKNCRTCIHSAPVAGGKWVCNGWRTEIPQGPDLHGCDNWQPIPNQA